MSILNAIGGPLVNSSVAAKSPIRIGWIRDPMDRFKSAYSYLRKIGERGRRGAEIVVDEYRVFVDFALANSNPHWNPQIKQLTHNGEFLPTVCYRFEDINKAWGLHSSKTLNHKNRTERFTIESAYRKDEIIGLYADDLEFWVNL